MATSNPAPPSSPADATSESHYTPRNTAVRFRPILPAPSFTSFVQRCPQNSDPSTVAYVNRPPENTIAELPGDSIIPKPSLIVLQPGGDAILASSQKPLMRFLVSSATLSRFSTDFDAIFLDRAINGDQTSVSQPPEIELPEDGNTLGIMLRIAHLDTSAFLPCFDLDPEAICHLGRAAVTYRCQEVLAQAILRKDPYVAVEQVGLQGIYWCIEAAIDFRDPVAFRAVTNYLTFEHSSNDIRSMVANGCRLDTWTTKQLTDQIDGAKTSVFQSFLRPIATILSCPDCHVEHQEPDWAWRMTSNWRSFSFHGALNRLAGFVSSLGLEDVQLCTDHMQDQTMPYEFKYFCPHRDMILTDIHRRLDATDTRAASDMNQIDHSGTNKDKIGATDKDNDCVADKDNNSEDDMGNAVETKRE
ncbi:hypothetical protein K461DRAFT_323537 [Myriangium duriaei CBS 260.36]|uniref:Uncharacterized protein n=1 Tax=Myriangium duriaei CBS 260.36 TaxID=1168546 RepID=A0A9P4IU68_9PEZI|nr:hypothetical protein K461DRAFT_323537 [Myriangium duriaei CBS 260.36]